MRYMISVSMLLLLLFNIDDLYPMGKSPALEHRVTWSNQGTRSEAKHGHLYINGSEIPDIFTLVVFQDSVYKFHQRKQLWGMDGYFPVEKTLDITSLKESAREIDADAKSRGWYTGSEKLSGTPADWLYAEWDSGAAFISPDKIKTFAAENSLKTIERWQTPPLRTGDKR